jgi:hypothetical protein
MKTMLMVLCATLCLACAALAADATGTWTGTLAFEGGNGESESALVTIRQDGDKVTGTAGPNPSQQFPLTGFVKDDQVSLEVKVASGRSINFELRLNGDQMTGRGELRQEGQVFGAATLTLKREPAKIQN